MDVRILRDGAGNTPAMLFPLVDRALEIIHAGCTVVLCCDHGISRSNAVAAAVLARLEACTYQQALTRVIVATRETGIKPRLVADLARLVEPMVEIRRRRGVYLLDGDSFPGRELSRLLDATLLCGRDDDGSRMENPALLIGSLAAAAADTVLLAWHPARLDTNRAAGDLIRVLRNVLEACAVGNRRLVFLSGFQVFNSVDGPGEVDCPETRVAQPGGADGDGLFLAEMLIEQYRRRGEVRALIIRTPRVYGPGDDRPWLLNTMARHAVVGRPLVTHEYDNGAARIDLLHVGDLARFVSQCLEQQVQGVIHAQGATASLPELASRLAKVGGAGSTMSTIRVAGTWCLPRLVASPGNTMAGWTPQVPLNQGVAGLIQSLQRTSS